MLPRSPEGLRSELLERAQKLGSEKPKAGTASRPTAVAAPWRPLEPLP